MQTLRRTVAVLTFPCDRVAGSACERETPTASNAVPPIHRCYGLWTLPPVG